VTDAATFAGLAPDAPRAHAALKAARELIRRGEWAVALDVLAGPDCRETPLARLLRADLLLALRRPEPALELVLAVHRAHGDTGQGLLCAGHAAQAQGERTAGAAAFARAAAVEPGRIAARVNAAAFFPPPPVAAASAPAVAVTSLPPDAAARCRAALASWTAAGFASILSVNTPAEIAVLARRFPQVAFVPAPTTALEAFGRSYAGLPRLLAAGAATGAAVVAVINADIALAAGPDFAGRLATAAAGGAVVACRADTAADRTAPAAYYYDVGFDLCAVDARWAERPELDGFYLGLPWWDYALPLAVVRAGGRLRFCPAPLCRHAAHEAAWSHRAFLNLGRRFVRQFWPQLADELLPGGDRAVDPGMETLLAGLGGRTAALLRRAPDAGLWDRTGFCPHDPGFAAALLPLTLILPDG